MNQLTGQKAFNYTFYKHDNKLFDSLFSRFPPAEADESVGVNKISPNIVMVCSWLNDFIQLKSDISSNTFKTYYDHQSSLAIYLLYIYCNWSNNDLFFQFLHEDNLNRWEKMKKTKHELQPIKMNSSVF